MLLNPTDTVGHYRITSVFISWLGAALGFVSVGAIQYADSYGGNQGVFAGQSYLGQMLWVIPRSGW